MLNLIEEVNILKESFDSFYPYQIIGRGKIAFNDIIVNIDDGYEGGNQVIDIEFHSVDSKNNSKAILTKDKTTKEALKTYSTIVKIVDGWLSVNDLYEGDKIVFYSFDARTVRLYTKYMKYLERKHNMKGSVSGTNFELVKLDD